MGAGHCLWISYGFVLGSWPIIVFNVIALGLGGIILWLKLRDGEDRSDAEEHSVRA
jgi:MtN3 and saliva related transmembrane protein